MMASMAGLLVTSVWQFAVMTHRKITRSTHRAKEMKFSSLKRAWINDWLYWCGQKVIQEFRDDISTMYYNTCRLHTMLGYVALARYEKQAA